MFHFGVDYYPEHWEAERLQIDAKLMQEAEVNVVRLAEFAWSRMEPEHGVYDFAWLDHAITVLGQHGIRIILGTPTASPPPWVMEKYPDAYIQWQDGRRATYGGRREYCPSHSGYRALSRQITRKMAEHFHDNPHVIGWQTDNEFGDRCYCDHCQVAFHSWLKARFDSLDQINTRWGTVFWSHEYNRWSQIPTPKKTGTIHNPGLELDYLRFMSDTYGSFQLEQIEILRELCPNHFITHNLMGFSYDNLNYFDFSEPLDFVSWDNYPRGFWIQDQQVDAARLALGHDTMRGLKQQNFWVMEAHSGPSGWDIIGSTPRPGEIRQWIYQAIAHGADGIVFFRWRTARFGAEQYWHGILDHDGTPRRRYAEFRQIGHELKKVGQQILGSQPQADVAMLLSYDSRFAFQIQSNNEQFAYPQHFLDYYRALFNRNISVNIVSPQDDYADLKLLIVPALYVVTPELAQKLMSFVRNGGTLLFTARSGVKEDSNAVINAPLPGLLREMCGIEIVDYDSLRNTETVDIVFSDTQLRVQSRMWSDVITLQGAEAVATFTTGYYAGSPAITSHAFGQGKVNYAGALAGEALADAVVAWLCDSLNIAAQMTGNIEVRERCAQGKRLVFAINHSGSAQTVTLDQSMTDLLSDTLLEAEFEIEPYGVRILSAT